MKHRTRFCFATFNVQNLRSQTILTVIKDRKQIDLSYMWMLMRVDTTSLKSNLITSGKVENPLRPATPLLEALP